MSSASAMTSLVASGMRGRLPGKKPSAARIREPEAEVVVGGLEDHVEAGEGAGEALADGLGFALLLLGHLLLGGDLRAGPAAVEEDEGADAVGVDKGGPEGHEGAHGMAGYR